MQKCFHIASDASCVFSGIFLMAQGEKEVWAAMPYSVLGATAAVSTQVNVMQNVWMETNTAELDGGAMHIELTGVGSDFVNITMIGNHAKSFGGAINEASTNMTLRDSLVANNVADLYGGGMFTFFAGLYLFNVNVTGNS